MGAGENSSDSSDSRLACVNSGQALSIRLLALGGHTHQLARLGEEDRIETGGGLKDSSFTLVSSQRFAPLADCVPGITVLFLAVLVRTDRLAQRCFSLLLALDQSLVLQARKLSLINLDGILDAVQLALRAAVCSCACASTSSTRRVVSQ